MLRSGSLIMLLLGVALVGCDSGDSGYNYCDEAPQYCEDVREAPADEAAPPEADAA